MANAPLTRIRYFQLILILGSLTALGPFTIDMYLPGFGAIAKDLRTDVDTVALSLSSYFLGISFGQLLYGPLLDRFGRKKPLYIGLAAYILTSISCIFVTDINWLISLRFIQAVGSCAAAVASIALVRDLFPAADIAKVFALLMLVVGASPMIAPTVGGYVTSSWHWHGVFIILTCMGILILLASMLWLPAGMKADTSLSLKPVPIFRGFIKVLAEPQFYTYTFAGSLAFAGLFAYVSGSPKVFMDYFGLTDRQYGWVFAALSVGFIGSSQVNSFLLKRFTSVQIVPLALMAQTVLGILFVIGSMYDMLGLPGTLVLLFLVLCAIGFINPNTSALAMMPFEYNAGTASSLMGFLQMGIGALASAGVSMLHVNGALPIAIVIASGAAIGLIVLLIGRRKVPEIRMSSNNNQPVLH